VKGIGTYTCHPDIVRDRGRFYTNTFDVFIPAIAQEKPAQTDTRLWAAAEKKLREVINGCPKGKTLNSVQRVKNNGEIPHASSGPSWPIRAARWFGGGIKWFFGEFSRNAVEGYATLHPIQKSYDH
jgi:hypothetical protein